LSHEGLPLEVHEAVRRAVGRSQDQTKKAKHDANILYHEYNLSPDKWNKLAFHRMAMDKGWAPATEVHRWGIFKRVIEALRLSTGPISIGEGLVTRRQRMSDVEPIVGHGSEISQPSSMHLPADATPSNQPLKRVDAFISLAGNLNFVWEQVLSGPGQSYEFPHEVTPFMRREYRGPAIYRWLAYAQEIGDRRDIYIGEAENLSRRIQGYLQPGSNQQTNVRMNARFRALTSEGLHVTIQRLRIGSLSLGEYEVGSSDLFNKHVRVFIEHMLIAYYTKAGFTLMNA